MRGERLILCYHAVSASWPADLSVTPDAFERQLRGWLRNGYHGATLSQSLDAERTGKTLVVTFDDGYLSTLTTAAPILERLGLRGTLYVPSDYIGQAMPMCWRGIEMWADGPYREELRPLDWDQVRQLDEMGWEIGSHTCSHPKLTHLGEEDLGQELAGSRARIEAELGKPCPTIAYPYGDVDARVAESARMAGYEAGVALPARWTDDSDPMQLPRVGVYNGQDRLKLGLKTSPLVRRLRILAGR